MRTVTGEVDGTHRGQEGCDRRGTALHVLPAIGNRHRHLAGVIHRPRGDRPWRGVGGVRGIGDRHPVGRPAGVLVPGKAVAEGMGGKDTVDSDDFEHWMCELMGDTFGSGVGDRDRRRAAYRLTMEAVRATWGRVTAPMEIVLRREAGRLPRCYLCNRPLVMVQGDAAKQLPEGEAANGQSSLNMCGRECTAGDTTPYNLALACFGSNQAKESYANWAMTDIQAVAFGYAPAEEALAHLDGRRRVRNIFPGRPPLGGPRLTHPQGGVPPLQPVRLSRIRVFAGRTTRPTSSISHCTGRTIDADVLLPMPRRPPTTGSDAPEFCQFFAPAGQVLTWAGVERLKDVGPGFQRMTNPARVRGVKRFFDQDLHMHPDRRRVDLASAGRRHHAAGRGRRPDLDGDRTGRHSRRPEARARNRRSAPPVGGLRVLPDHGLLVVALVNPSDLETAFQFLVINNKSARAAGPHPGWPSITSGMRWRPGCGRLDCRSRRITP